MFKGLFCKNRGVIWPMIQSFYAKFGRVGSLSEVIFRHGIRHIKFKARKFAKDFQILSIDSWEVT